MVNYIINYNIKNYIPKILTIVDILGENKENNIKEFFYISKKDIEELKNLKKSYLKDNNKYLLNSLDQQLEIVLKQLKNYENSVKFMKQNNILETKNGIYKITNNGKKHLIKYRKKIQKEKGFENYLEYLDDIFQEMGYRSYSSIKSISESIKLQEKF